MKLADEAYVIDIYDIEAHIGLAEGLRDRLAGVFTEGADVEVTVASVAAALGLPGIAVVAALNCKDKIRMRQCFDAAGISPVRWIDVSGGKLLNAPYLLNTPYVLKPSNNCGSRGVHIIREKYPPEYEFEDALKNSTDKRVLAEEYLEGPQQSVEILFDSHGICHWLNIVDRHFDGVIELGHVNPSNLPELDRIALFQLTEVAAAAVGVHFGAFKADTIWTANGPRILEVTARLSGGFDCQLSTPKSTGRNFIRVAMSVSCGIPIDKNDLYPKWNKYCAVWGVFPTPGKVIAMGIDDDVIYRVHVGDVIEPYTHCAMRPAFVYSVDSTYDKAVSDAKEKSIRIAKGIITDAV
jgi:biotin carboxylase